MAWTDSPIIHLKYCCLTEAIHSTHTYSYMKNFSTSWQRKILSLLQELIEMTLKENSTRKWSQWNNFQQCLSISLMWLHRDFFQYKMDSLLMGLEGGRLESYRQITMKTAALTLVSENKVCVPLFLISEPTRKCPLQKKHWPVKLLICLKFSQSL